MKRFDDKFTRLGLLRAGLAAFGRSLGMSFAALALFLAATGCVSGPHLAPDRVGVCSWSWQLPMREVVAQMEENGIRGVNLALVPFIAHDKYHGGSEDPDTWAFIKEKVGRGEITVMSTMISTVGEDYTTLESIRRTGGIVPDEHWAENRKIVTEGARLTQEIGAKYMLLHAGFLDESNPRAYAKYVSRVKWMRDECRKYGVTLILESGQETAEDLASFLVKVHGVGINFDPANMILYAKGTPMDALKILRPWIRQVHVKDACLTKTPGTWGQEVPWGTGEVGGDSFVKALEEMGYTGNYVVEREAGDSRAEDITRAVRALTR